MTCALEGLKLLIEHPNYEIEYVLEEKNTKEPSSLFIHGPYLMAEQKNKNGRVYKLDEMLKEVTRYNKEMIETNRSIGELNHPTSVEINPERACHKLVSLKQEGNTFVGKSKILNTPMGHLVRNLILDGVKLGISSRALGKLNQNGDHNDVSDFRLICCDIVHDPSVETAFINGILESKEWLVKCDGTICELYDKFEKKIESIPNKDADAYLREQILNFIQSLKTKK